MDETRLRDSAVGLLEVPDRHDAADDPGPPARGIGIAGVVLGRIVALRAPDCALVVLKGRESAPAVRAKTLVRLPGDATGRDVALMFEEGDAERPVILGCVVEVTLTPSKGLGDGAERAAPEPVSIDAETIVLTGRNEIVLRCGQASVTLRKDGRVVVRGTRVESRAQGLNRIKGGSVQIN